MTERKEMTIREYAQHERVTTRTVWVWIRKGALDYRRTPGGGVRIITLSNPPSQSPSKRP